MNAKLIIATLIFTTFTCACVDRPSLEDPPAGAAEHELLTKSVSPARFGGVWRVQWNAGNPIYTPVVLDVPSGVQIGIARLGLRGAGTFYAYADGMISGYVVLTAGHQTGLDYTDRAAIGVQSPDRLTGAPLVTIDSAVQSRMQAASPSIVAPLGAQALTGRIVSRMVMGYAVNDYDPALEDAMIYATGAILF